MKFSNLIKLILLGGIFGAHSSCFSQDLVFHCTVKQVLEVSDAGVLTEKSNRQLAFDMIGTQFIINQENGVITGRIISTKYAKSILVVDKGVRGNNFKVSGVIEHWHPTIFYLEVVTILRKFNPEAVSIPFSGQFSGRHIAGICT